MRHKSNYDWMLFLTSPMTFVGFKPTTSCSQSNRFNLLDHGCSLDWSIYWR